MATSFARTLDFEDTRPSADTALNGVFGVAVFNASQASSTAANANTAIQSQAYDENLNHPTPQFHTLEQQLIKKLDQGLEGEAFDLLMKRLEGRPTPQIITTLSRFAELCTNRGFNDLAKDLRQITKNLSHETPTPNSHPAPAP